MNKYQICDWSVTKKRLFSLDTLTAECGCGEILDNLVKIQGKTSSVNYRI